MTVFLIVVGGWLASVCLHEFGHALTAYLGGDKGVRQRGYLTNPVKYFTVDSIVTSMLLLALGGLGLPGAAVMVDERRIRSRLMRVMLSLAGPFMSAVAGIIFAVPFVLGIWSATDPRPLVVAVGMLVQLQAMAVVLNLLPIPPLDGFQAIASLLLPYGMKRRLMRISGWIFFVVVMYLMFRHGDFRRLIWDTTFTFTAPLGFTSQSFAHAFDQFQFWR